MSERCHFECVDQESGLLRCLELDTRDSIETFIEVAQKAARIEIRRAGLQNCIQSLVIDLVSISFGIQEGPARRLDNFVTLPSNVRIVTVNFTVYGKQMTSIKAKPNSVLIVYDVMTVYTKERVSISLEKFSAKEFKIYRQEETRKNGGVLRKKTLKEYPLTKLKAKEGVISGTVKMLGFHPDFTSFEGSWTCENGVQYVYNMGQSVKNEPIHVQGQSSQQSTHGGGTQVISQHQEDQEDAEAGGSTTEEAQGEDEDYDEEH